jgi:hypothetical protein
MHDKECRLLERKVRGYRGVVLENSQLAVTLLPEKGGEIYEIVYKPLNFDILWKAPWGLSRPNPVLATSGDSEAAWMDAYGGGWQGIFPNGGDSCVYQGAALGFHGEASTANWDYHCRQSPTSVRIEMEVDLVRSPFKLRKEVSIESGSLAVQIHESVVNQAEKAYYAMWGHHPAFATKLIDGAHLETAARRYESHIPEISATGRLSPGSVQDWPQMIDKEGCKVDLSRLPTGQLRISEMGYLSDFERGQYTLSNETIGLSVTLCWDANIFPYLWYWLEWGGSSQYPWYGRCRVAAFEPFSSVPCLGLTRAIEQNTALLFSPFQTLSTELQLNLGPHDRRVANETSS